MTHHSLSVDTWQGLCVSRWLRMEPGLTTSLVAPATATAGDAFTTVDELERGLRNQRYVAERGLATTLYLTLKLGKPLLLEGEAGVGKTEIAKVLADVLQTPLIRLQCYEGLDAATAIYEWDYPRQMLYLRTVEATGGESRQAVRHELFSDFQVTVPEIGTIRAEHVPVVILTSNRTREIHDALKRRCLYHWIDFPDYDKEFRILQARVPEAPHNLARQIVAFTQGLRGIDLFKPPGMAETLDWSRALLALGTVDLNEQAVDDSLGVILKYQEDVDSVRGDVAANLVGRALLRS